MPPSLPPTLGAESAKSIGSRQPPGAPPGRDQEVVQSDGSAMQRADDGVERQGFGVASFAAPPDSRQP